jgi:hypothetical protein
VVEPHRVHDRRVAGRRARPSALARVPAPRLPDRVGLFPQVRWVSRAAVCAAVC